MQEDRWKIWSWYLESLALDLGPMSLALSLTSLALALALWVKSLGLGIQVLGLEPQVLVNITAWNMTSDKIQDNSPSTL